MGRMNAKMNIPALQAIMREFEMQVGERLGLCGVLACLCDCHWYSGLCVVCCSETISKHRSHFARLRTQQC
jgi:hypothetical protein